MSDIYDHPTYRLLSRSPVWTRLQAEQKNMTLSRNGQTSGNIQTSAMHISLMTPQYLYQDSRTRHCLEVNGFCWTNPEVAIAGRHTPYISGERERRLPPVGLWLTVNKGDAFISRVTQSQCDSTLWECRLETAWNNRQRGYGITLG